MKARFLTCLAGACALASPIVATSAAQAGSPDGKIQVKILATGVLPDGKISSVLKDNVVLGETAGVPAGTQTTANNNWVPTAAIEYFFTPNVSVETICCFTSHHVDGAGAIAGVNHMIDNIMILPATVTLKAHATGLGPIKPYVGAGPAYFIVLDSHAGPGAAAIGATSAKLSSKVGFALQGGVDIAVNDSGLGVSFDAKRYFMKPVATFSDSSGVLLSTRHNLDPWVVSAGIAYRF